MVFSCMDRFFKSDKFDVFFEEKKKEEKKEKKDSIESKLKIKIILEGIMKRLSCISLNFGC